MQKNLTWNYVGIRDYFEVGFLKGRGVRKTKQKWYTVQTWLSQTLKKDKLLIFCDFFFVWWFFFSFSYFCTKELLFPLHFTRKMKEKLGPWAEARGQKFDFLHLRCCVMIFSYWFFCDIFFMEVWIIFWSGNQPPLLKLRMNFFVYWFVLPLWKLQKCWVKFGIFFFIISECFFIVSSGII
jgi:hypothetical protein